MMYTYGDHVSGWGYALGITSMILFWTLLTLAIAAAVRYLGFARGEIDADEYHQRLDTLRQAARPAPTKTQS